MRTAQVYNSDPRKYLVNTYINRDLCFVEGEGCYLIDIYGQRYLDLGTNYGVNIFGYKHPYLTACLRDQLEKLISLHGSFNNNVRAKAAEMLVSRCGRGLSQVYFSNSGSEAVEAALKFAVLATGRRKFIACEGSYHGKTLGALSATFHQKYRHPFEPLLWDFTFIPYGDTQALKSAIDEQTAAFIVEPIQGESGVIMPPSGFLSEAYETCRQNGVLLIIDEIQTGLGRTGSFLASEKEIEEYDIVCLGKGLAGGIPAGATLISRKIAKNIMKGIHTSTFGGNPLACAGITATLNLINEDLFCKIQSLGQYFMAQLTEIFHHSGFGVRGKGFMIGLKAGNLRNELLRKLQSRGILALPGGEEIVRFLPPYIIEKHQLELTLEIISDLVPGRYN